MKTKKPERITSRKYTVNVSLFEGVQDKEKYNNRGTLLSNYHWNKDVITRSYY